MSLFLISAVTIAIFLTVLPSLVSYGKFPLKIAFPTNVVSKILRRMGGDAFENTVRLNIAEYTRVRDVVLAELRSLGFDAVCPPEVADKETFGDIDFCIADPESRSLKEITTTICRSFSFLLHKIEAPKKHGNIISFLTIERYQIDVAVVHQDDLRIHVAAAANGDFAWILQMSLNLQGLLLNSNGLFLRNRKLVEQGLLSKRGAQFLLSKDPALISSFLGLPEHAFDGKTSLSFSA